MKTAEIITKIGHISELQDKLTERLYSPEITEEDSRFFMDISNVLDNYVDELEAKVGPSLASKAYAEGGQGR
jgi:hypothetical protein